MNSIKKLFSVLLCVSLIIGTLPIMIGVTAETQDTPALQDISYKNSFDVGTVEADLYDFTTYWGSGNTFVAANNADYITVDSGYAARANTTSNYSTIQQNFNNVQTSLITQKYADLELTSTIKLTAAGPGWAGFNLGEQILGGKTFWSSGSDGYSVIFHRYGGDKMWLHIYNNGTVLNSSGEWVTCASATTNVYDITTFKSTFGYANTTTAFDIKLTVSGTTLTAYIKHATSGEYISLGQYTLPNYKLGYVSMIQGTAQVATATSTPTPDQYYDNLSISGKGVKAPSAGVSGSIYSYSNTFNGKANSYDGNSLGAIMNDFDVFYTANSNNTAGSDYKYYIQNNAAAITKQIKLTDGKIYRIVDTSVTANWQMWYKPLIMSYKHSSFDDVNIKFVAGNQGATPSQTLLRFGASAKNQSSYNPDGTGGYTLSFGRAGGKWGILRVLYKGTVIKSIAYGEGTAIANNATYKNNYVQVTGYGDVLKESTVEVDVTDGALTVSMLDSNGDMINIISAFALDGYTRGYVGIGFDIGDGANTSYINSLSITGEIIKPSASMTDTSIRLANIDGYEYSIDGINYQDSNVFTELQPETTYTVYQRVKAVDYFTASEAASLEVTTEAEPYKGGISYSNSFDVGDVNVDLADFAVYYGKNDTTTFIPVNPASYLTSEVGGIGRLTQTTDIGRSYRVNIAKTSLMTQKYTDFTLTSTVKLTGAGPGVGGFVIGEGATNEHYASADSNGYAIAFVEVADQKLRLQIIHKAQVLDATKGWVESLPYTSNYYIEMADLATNYGIAHRYTPFEAKIVMTGKYLDVYLFNPTTSKWIAVVEQLELADYTGGHISMFHSAAQTTAGVAVDQYFDNLNIIGYGEYVATSAPEYTALTYSNELENPSLEQLTNDFDISYAENCNDIKNGEYSSSALSTASDILKHIKPQDGRIYRNHNGSVDWNMYYNSLFMTYKNAEYSNVSVSITYNNGIAVPTNKMIRLGVKDAYQSSYNPNGTGGYTIGLQHDNTTNAVLQLVGNGKVLKTVTFGSSDNADIFVDGYGLEFSASTVTATVEKGILTVSILDKSNETVELISDFALENYSRGKVGIGFDTGDSKGSYIESISITGSTEAAVAEQIHENYVTLKKFDGYEYSIDGITYQSSPTFGELQANTEYTFYQRVAATEVYEAGEASEALTVKTSAIEVFAPQAPTLYSVTKNEIVLEEISGYEYSIDGEIWQEIATFSGLIPETEYTFYSRVAATESATASAASAPLTITSRVLYGDVSNDGTVDTNDLPYLRKHLLGVITSVAQKGSDVNADDELDIRDLVRLKKYFTDTENVLLGSASGEYPQPDSQYFSGMSALYLGDSISYGAGDDVKGEAWCARIESLYGLAGKNVSQSGWVLANNVTSGTSTRGTIISQLTLNGTVPSNYNYIIMQGGVNDIWTGQPELGSITADGTTEFDTDTTIGALENLFYTAKQKAPNAKLGFIINFRIKGVFSETEWDAYVVAAKQVCDKWGVSYLDLTNNDAFNAVFNAADHLPDKVHPNSAGYDILARYIGEWIKTIK